MNIQELIDALYACGWKSTNDAQHEHLIAWFETTLKKDNSFMFWTCGCGWINGCNLNICAQCSRNPLDGQARIL
ncbi:MAG: hypothetical protein NUV74_05560 [Candidatus Brocadiaceae bacterium]|nr:hypothetical protein [Candidatus Brocadiaceae bacterium]